LGSWTPRRPSARLKAGIFQNATVGEMAGDTSGEVTSHRSAAGTRWPVWNWLCPALACLMLSAVILGRGYLPAQPAKATSSTLLASLALSNQLFNACQTSTIHHQHNLWQSVTLVSAKTTRPATSAVLWPALNTNTLLFRQ